MAVQTVIKLRRDTAANWSSVNPTLSAGEMGFETDTQKIKVGNGTSTWTLLDYTSSGGAATVVSDVAPTEDLVEGMIWFDSAEGNTYIYYDSVWVEASPSIAGPEGPVGPAGTYYVSSTAPSTPEAGFAWLNTNDGRLYVYDGTTWFEPTNNQEGPAGATGATGATGTSGVVAATAPVTYNSGTQTVGVDSTVVITTGTQTLTNKTITSPFFNGSTLESAFTVATGFAGYTYDSITNGAVQYITANSTANGAVNIRGSAFVSLNAFMAVNQAMTFVLAITNTTAYYPTSWQIDGVTVTPKWSGGTAPTSGNANSIDVYTMTIIKTGSAAYTVLGAQTKFA
jgi:hypothetical protein